LGGRVVYSQLLVLGTGDDIVKNGKVRVSSQTQYWVKTTLFGSSSCW
jgi:hypothetical protein